MHTDDGVTVLFKAQTKTALMLLSTTFTYNNKIKLVPCRIHQKKCVCVCVLLSELININKIRDSVS